MGPSVTSLRNLRILGAVHNYSHAGPTEARAYYLAIVLSNTWTSCTDSFIPAAGFIPKTELSKTRHIRRHCTAVGVPASI